jgi:hypothetical protein
MASCILCIVDNLEWCVNWSSKQGIIMTIVAMITKINMNILSSFGDFEYVLNLFLWLLDLFIMMYSSSYSLESCFENLFIFSFNSKLTLPLLLDCLLLFLADFRFISMNFGRSEAQPAPK